MSAARTDSPSTAECCRAAEVDPPPCLISRRLVVKMIEMMEKLEKKMKDLEALPVDNAGAGLVVLLLGDPHLLEGGQGSQDGATDPDGVLPLGRSNDLEEERVD